MANGVVDIEVRIIDPDRPAEVTRYPLDHLPVAGDEPSFPAIMDTRSSMRGVGPSKMPMEAMCMWLTPSSMLRKDESRGLSRSRITKRYLESVQISQGPGTPGGRHDHRPPSGGTVLP